MVSAVKYAMIFGIFLYFTVPAALFIVSAAESADELLIFFNVFFYVAFTAIFSWSLL